MSFFRFKTLLILGGDIALFYASLLLTLYARYGDGFTREIWQSHLPPFSILLGIWLVIFYINNLYSVQLARNDLKFYSHLTQSIIVNALVGFTYFYLVPVSLTSLRPFRVLIILLVIFALLIFAWRRFIYLLTSSTRLRNNLLTIGINKEALQLAHEIHVNPQLGYLVTLFIDFENCELPDSLKHVPRYRELTNLKELIIQHRIQTIVTVGNSHSTADVSRYLFEILNLGLSYFSFPDFYERLTGKVPIASLEKSWFLENLLSGEKRWYELIKRIIDIACVLIFGICSLILVPFIIAGVLISSPGPIFFRQVRTGRGGRQFTAMKFRTMRQDAEANGAQWATKDDPRVTKFGRFLRKTRLDELPQFINILRGDMSFVGPRPERPEFVRQLNETIPYYRERLLVKPGLSGWAQINYKYGDTIEDAVTKLQYDLFYVKNRSLALDISIILKTVRTVFDASLGQ